MSKQVILTGLRANNDLHLGNYLGGLLPMIDMAANRAGEYQINLFVPDLHSFTTPTDHSKLQSQIMQNIRMYFAAGLPLDNPDIHVYRQSYIPAHSELTWILDCFTGFGEMRRMTQFKDKASKFLDSKVPDEATYDDVLTTSRTSVSVGLFNYPVLMASDILLYDSVYVPVGDDQTQHLEFTRDIAERMNNQFGKLFTVPKPVKEQHEFFGKDQGLRIRDLVNPDKKMSKSAESDKGVIFLSDKPEDAVKKIMGATTDSVGSINYDWENQPGICNLLDIATFISGDHLQTVIDQWSGNHRYGDLKKYVAAQLEKFLTDLQDKFNNVDESAVIKKLEDSEIAMSEVASKKLYQVQKAVGLRA